MRLYKTLYTVIPLLIFVSGCSIFSSILVKTPEISGIDNIKITEISLYEAEFLISLNVTNDNNFNIDVNRLKYNVYVNDEYLGAGSTVKSQTLVSNKISQLSLPLKIKYLDLPSNVVDILKNAFKGNKIKYKVEGEADVEAVGYDASIPLDIERELIATRN